MRLEKRYDIFKCDGCGKIKHFEYLFDVRAELYFSIDMQLIGGDLPIPSSWKTYKYDVYGRELCPKCVEIRERQDKCLKNMD